MLVKFGPRCLAWIFLEAYFHQAASARTKIPDNAVVFYIHGAFAGLDWFPTEITISGLDHSGSPLLLFLVPFLFLFLVFIFLVFIFVLFVVFVLFLLFFGQDPRAS